MSLGLEVYDSKKLGGPNSEIVIWVDKFNLLPAAKKLFDFEKDDNVIFRNNIQCSPIETLRLLYTVQYTAYNSHLGSAKTELNSFCFMDTDGSYQQNIEQYIEYVKSKTWQIIGWRFFFVVRKPEFKIETALMTYWDMQLKKKRDKAEPEDESLLTVCRTRMEWIVNAISPYTNERFGDPEIYNLATCTPLDDENNPVNARYNLTLEWTNELILLAHANTVHPDYVNINLYTRAAVVPAAIPEGEEEEDDAVPLLHAAAANPEGEEENANPANPGPVLGALLTHIHFPRGAYPLEHQCRDPKHVFFMDLVTPPPPAAFNLNEKEFRRKQRVGAQQTSNDSDINSVFEGAQKWCTEQMKKCTTPEQKNAVRHSHEAMEMIRSVLYHATNNPGGLATVIWKDKQVRENENWTAALPPYGTTDPTISDYGNMLAAELFILEVSTGTAVVHPEIMLVQHATLSLFNVLDVDLRQHFLFPGPPAGSKSFILDTHLRLSIPDTQDWISSESKKANTADECCNAVQMVYDELGESFTEDGDGSGGSIIKEIMTRGMSTNRMLVIDPLKKNKRTLVKTVSQHRRQILAATNLNKMRLMEAIRSRFYIHSCPLMKREGVDPVMEKYRMQNDARYKGKFEELAYRCQTSQMLANVLWVMMNVGLIPLVDMRLVTKLSSVTFKYLADHGAEVEFRDRQRIMLQTISETIFYAINQVFFSGKYLATGTKFDISQLLLCIPHLSARPEHFYAALGLMNNTVSDPGLSLILTAIRELLDNIPEVDKRYATTRDNSNVKNYNYYCISVSTIVQTGDTNMDIATLLLAQISSTANVTLDKYNVKDILTWLCSRKHSAVEYDTTGAPDPEKKKKESQPVACIRRTGSNCGLEISRDYLDTMTTKKTCLISEAIKFTMGCVPTCPRVVTGLTLKFEKDCIPFLFTVVELDDSEKKEVKPLMVESDSYVRFGEALIFNTPDVTPTSKFEFIHGDVGTKFLEEWYETTGTRPTLLAEPPVVRKGKANSYPKTFKEAYLKEIKILTEEAEKAVPEVSKASHKRQHVATATEEEEEEGTLAQTRKRSKPTIN